MTEFYASVLTSYDLGANTTYTRPDSFLDHFFLAPFWQFWGLTMSQFEVLAFWALILHLFRQTAIRSAHHRIFFHWSHGIKVFGYLLIRIIFFLLFLTFVFYQLIPFCFFFQVYIFVFFCWYTIFLSDTVILFLVWSSLLKQRSLCKRTITYVPILKYTSDTDFRSKTVYSSSQ